VIGAGSVSTIPCAGRKLKSVAIISDVGTLSLDELADRCHVHAKRVIEDNIRTLAATGTSARCSVSSILLQNRAMMETRPVDLLT
jgi:hypothetical protein